MKREYLRKIDKKKKIAAAWEKIFLVIPAFPETRVFFFGLSTIPTLKVRIES